MTVLHLADNQVEIAGQRGGHRTLQVTVTSQGVSKVLTISAVPIQCGTALRVMISQKGHVLKNTPEQPCVSSAVYLPVLIR